MQPQPDYEEEDPHAIWQRHHDVTEEQTVIFDYILTHTWAETMANFEITSKGTLNRCIHRTALGYRWSTDNTNQGNLPYLSYVYEERLARICSKHADAHDCLTTGEVLALAKMVRAEMFRSAREALYKRGCHALANKTVEDDVEPSSDWIAKFVERHELRVVSGQQMERIRTLSCDRSRIIEYFIKWIPTFNRDPRLIFGADETDVKPSFRMKVVTNARQQGHVADEPIKHLTAMCCHSAGGAAVPPYFVLTNLQNLPRELSTPYLSGPDHAWYCSTTQGWMTEGTFYAWVMMLVAWMGQYRANVLPAHLKQSEILLILDGHSSRRCPWAIPLLRFHGISVLVLPAHTTHLLQAFDVVLASPLKSHFRRFLAAEKQANEHRRGSLSQAAWSRLVTVAAFIRAWRCVTSGSLCARSFEKVGIFPLCPDVVLRSPFVVTVPNPDLEEKTFLNNTLLTTDEMVTKLLEAKQAAGHTLPVPSPDFDDYRDSKWPAHKATVTWMRAQKTAWGRLLSWPADMIFPFNGQWTIVETFRAAESNILSTQSVLNMIQRLSALEHERAEEALEEAIEANAQAESQQLQLQVLKTTAKQLAQSIAADIVDKRLAELSKLVVNEVTSRLQQALDELNETPEDEVSETNKLVVGKLELVAEKANNILQEWLRGDKDVDEVEDPTEEPGEKGQDEDECQEDED